MTCLYLSTMSALTLANEVYCGQYMVHINRFVSNTWTRTLTKGEVHRNGTGCCGLTHLTMVVEETVEYMVDVPALFRSCCETYGR